MTHSVAAGWPSVNNQFCCSGGEQRSWSQAARRSPFGWSHGPMQLLKAVYSLSSTRRMKEEGRMQKAEPEAFNRKERKGRKEFSFSALFALLSVRVAQFREDFPDAVYSL